MRRTGILRPLRRANLLTNTNLGENHDMNEKLKNYIAARQLNYLWSFQGESYFETQLGKIISLTQIEREIS